jgi:hypothetical protein
LKDHHELQIIVESLKNVDEENVDHKLFQDRKEEVYFEKKIYEVASFSNQPKHDDYDDSGENFQIDILLSLLFGDKDLNVNQQGSINIPNFVFSLELKCCYDKMVLSNESERTIVTPIAKVSKLK